MVSSSSGDTILSVRMLFVIGAIFRAPLFMYLCNILTPLLNSVMYTHPPQYLTEDVMHKLCFLVFLFYKSVKTSFWILFEENHCRFLQGKTISSLVED
ncbi:hypothetical protein JTE90_009828 [Oedothorax gibbosus]|uniref:Uncharacterized protein n=1 Tax=Oedothorax gibbosus TaxID=931172 RepID=A0AAV6UCU9_9ARAC|nr:hypothetical protein JTE90_009828 [Oedothorax gibbosus]